MAIISIEEKAKRYDDALERAKDFIKGEVHYALRKGENIMCWVFPELRENEDEQHRKWILEYLYDGLRKSDEQFKGQFKAAIAWLEKQVSACLSRDDEIMIRQLTEYFTTGKGLQNTNNTIVEWLVDVKRKLEKQGEQKPAFGMKTPEESLGIDSETYNKIVDECIYGNAEQKPAWSEEDEKKLNVIYSCVNSYYDGLAKDALLIWLKSIKPQPKQEWSEEDENNILFLTSIIEECFKDKEKITLCGDTVCANFTKEDVIDRLKSLRPQPHWKPRI